MHCASSSRMLISFRGASILFALRMPPALLSDRYSIIDDSDTFHHLPDPKGMMELLHSCLKPMGSLVICEFYSGQKGERFHGRNIVANNVCAKLTEYENALINLS